MLRKILICVSIINALILSIMMGFEIKDFYISILIAIGSYAVLLLGYIIFIFVCSLFVNLKKEYKTRSKFYEMLTITTMKLLMDFLHVKITLKGEEKLPDDNFMFVYNHTSNFDGFVQTIALSKYRLIHISKPENFKLPLVGPMIYRCGYISIDRNSTRNALKAISKAGDLLNKREASIVISPEGTRNKTSEPLLEFKDGCFHIVMKGKAPLVICKMENVNKTMKNFPFKRTNVVLNIIETIPYERLEGMKAVEISNMAREILLKEMVKEVEA